MIFTVSVLSRNMRVRTRKKRKRQTSDCKRRSGELHRPMCKPFLPNRTGKHHSTVTVQPFRSRKRFLETFFRLLPTQKKQETNNCVNNDIFTVRAGSVACSSRCCSCGAWCDIGEGVILWGRREGVETSAGVLWEGGM